MEEGHAALFFYRKGEDKMNIVFYILVIICAVLAWIVLSGLFNAIGSGILSIFINTRDNIQKTKEETQDEKKKRR